MALSYFIPGWGYINEGEGQSYFIPGWGYVNEQVKVSYWQPEFPDRINYLRRLIQDTSSYLFPVASAPVYTPVFSLFPDTQNKKLNITIGFENLTPNITYSPALDLADWNNLFPDKQKQFLQRSALGFEILTPNITSTPALDVDDWTVVSPDKIISQIFRNTGSAYYLYPIVIIPPSGSHYVPHKRRGQAGTTQRGVGGAAGNQEGQ